MRELAVGLLFAIIVAWWYVGGHTTRDPKLLGAVAGRGSAAVDAVTGGIGRFTRPRTTPPCRLR